MLLAFQYRKVWKYSKIQKIPQTRNTPGPKHPKQGKLSLSLPLTVPRRLSTFECCSMALCVAREPCHSRALGLCPLYAFHHTWFQPKARGLEHCTSILTSGYKVITLVYVICSLQMFKLGRAVQTRNSNTQRSKRPVWATQWNSEKIPYLLIHALASFILSGWDPFHFTQKNFS